MLILSLNKTKEGHQEVKVCIHLETNNLIWT